MPVLICVHLKQVFETNHFLMLQYKKKRQGIAFRVMKCNRVEATVTTLPLSALTHSCPPFQHLLSERLTSLSIMGTPQRR